MDQQHRYIFMAIFVDFLVCVFFIFVFLILIPGYFFQREKRRERVKER